MAWQPDSFLGIVNKKATNRGKKDRNPEIARHPINYLIILCKKAQLKGNKMQNELTPEELERARARAAADTTAAEQAHERIIEKVINRIGSNPRLLEDLVAYKFLDIKTNDEAKKRYLAATNTHGYRTMDVMNLTEMLLLPVEEETWRIEGLIQVGHNTTLAARYKVGKTTLITNLLRSLVDGDDFLGEFKVQAVTKPIVVFNHELSDKQFTEWLRRAGIKNTHLIIPVNLRGKGLYLQDEEAQEWAIELLKSIGAEMWIIDPLQAALRGTVNDDTVASDWIAAAERVKAEAGVSELFLVTHTGHLSKADESGRSSNERTAGSARWAGWPDALLAYTMDDEGTRYISAEGRDVRVPERGLNYDDKTMRLTSKGPDSGRADAKADRPYNKIIAFLTDHKDKTFTRKDFEVELRMSNKLITDGIRAALDTGLVEEVQLPKKPGQKGPSPVGYKLSPVSSWLDRS